MSSPMNIFIVFFFQKLSFFSSQYLLDKEAASSVVQDVFTELWASRMKLQNDTNIQAWLFTVTKNKSLKLIGKERSRQNYQDYIRARQMAINYQSLSQFDTSNFDLEELKDKIKNALLKLSPASREVFEMSRYQDKKNKEIAEELNISIKTVEAHISKALKLLREELRDYLPLINILFF